MWHLVRVRGVTPYLLGHTGGSSMSLSIATWYPPASLLSFCIPVTIQESRVESCKTRKPCLPWVDHQITPATGRFPPGNLWKFPSVGKCYISSWVQMVGVCFSLLFNVLIFKVTLILANVGHYVFRYCFSEDFSIFP